MGGFQAFQKDPYEDDIKLRTLLIDRIYDTYVDEVHFDHTDHKIAGHWLLTLEPRDYSSPN